jgi:hypothetical protein
VGNRGRYSPARALGVSDKGLKRIKEFAALALGGAEKKSKLQKCAAKAAAPRYKSSSTCTTKR